MITAIIFDWGSVMAPDNNVLAAKKLSKKYGCDEEELKNFLCSLEEEYLEAAVSRPYYSIVSEKFGIPRDELIEVLDDDPPSKDMMNLVRKLAEKYTLAILSDQIKIKTDSIKERYNLSMFTETFWSNETHIRKPKPEAFKNVLRTLNKKPEECLFIDDTKENIAAAKKLGIHTHLFTTYEKLVKTVEF